MDLDRRLRALERGQMAQHNGFLLLLEAQRLVIAEAVENEPAPLSIPQRPTILRELGLGHDLEQGGPDD